MQHIITESQAVFKWVNSEELAKSMIYRLNPDGTRMPLMHTHILDNGIGRQLNLPRRQTHRSAGYDFEFPYSEYTLFPSEAILIQTGVKIEGLDINEDLELHIRSGRGIFQRLRILNVVGIVDADYELSDTDGNIGIAIINEGSEPYKFEFGERFAQGIIRPHLFTKNDSPVDKQRTGGGSSTDEQ